jgi:hypothetical protein
LLKTIRFKNYFYEEFLLKNINNINFFVLNYKQSFYKKNYHIYKITEYFVHSYVIYFLRIQWRGKAFRIRYFKKNSKFTFNFGHSHWCKLIFLSSVYNFFKIRRQSYLIIFKKRLESSQIISSFNSLRTMNKYTKRGIRIKNSPYIKRFGKISQVNSSLHSFG